MNAKFTLYHLRLSQETRLALVHGARAILPLVATDSGSNNAMEDEDDAMDFASCSYRLVSWYW